MHCVALQPILGPVRQLRKAEGDHKSECPDRYGRYAHHPVRVEAHYRRAPRPKDPDDFPDWMETPALLWRLRHLLSPFHVST